MVNVQENRQFRHDQTLRRGPMLIEASAGTGKTYALSNLLLRLLVEEKLPIQKILVVTFTRAAAAELRSRIRARIEQTLGWLEREVSPSNCEGRRKSASENLWHGDPVWKKFVDQMEKTGESGIADARHLLVQALEDFDSATITTIHGFCQLVLGFSAFETGVDFEATLSENLDALLQEAVDDFWALRLADSKLEWYTYLVERCKISRHRLLNLAKILEADPQIHIVSQFHIVPQRSEAGAAFERWRHSWSAFREEWSKGTGSELANQLVVWAKEKQFRNAREYNGKRPLKMAQAVEQWLQDHESSVLPDRDMQGKIEYFSGSKIAATFLDPSQFPGHVLANVAQNCLQSGGEAFLSDFSYWIGHELKRRKRKQKIMSFSDLLHRLASSLDSSTTAHRLVEELNGRYEAALIDEFQDTDPIQWSIFRRLFVEPRKCWSIFVGDPKQSIYGFRGADIYAYLQARLVSADNRYTMAENWRSDPGYVEAVNALFDRPNLFLHQEIQYPRVKAAQGEDRLHFTDLPWRPLHIRCFASDGAESPESPESPESVGPPKFDERWCREQIHQVVADDIVELLNSSTQLDSTISRSKREILPRDIAVLVRSNRQAETMRSALQRRGVPAVISGVGSVFQTLEAEAMQRLLDAWLQPSSTAKLRAVLITPLFAKRAEDLLAIDDHGWDLWSERMHDWSHCWRNEGIAAALRKMTTEQNIAESVVKRANGERRLSNWLHLCELLHLESERRQFGPEALSRWLHEKRSRQLQTPPEENELLRLESDAEAVTILTVHRSKGLEFGVVFCPYLWQGKVWKSNSLEHQQLRFHDRQHGHRLSLDLGLDLGLDSRPELDPDLDTKRSTKQKASHVKWALEDRLAENMRLAYVALTRARHACIVYWGPFPNIDLSPLAQLLRKSESRSGLDHNLAMSPIRWSQMDAVQWQSELTGLQAENQDSISLAPVEQRSLTQYKAPPIEVAEIQVQDYSRRSIAPRWTRSSFSSLTAMAYWQPAHSVLSESEFASPAFDESIFGTMEAAESLEVESSRSTLGAGETSLATNTASLPFSMVPGGPRWGNHIHTILERFDFSTLGTPSGQEALAGIVDRQLQLELDQGPPVRNSLLQGLRDVLQTPLGSSVDNLQLQDINSADRLHELRFDFPVANTGNAADRMEAVTVEQIADVLARATANGTKQSPVISSGYIGKLARLGGQIRGFMTGSIDLVFRHRRPESNQWFIVDYKSNRLHSGLRTTQDASQRIASSPSETSRDWEAYRPDHLCEPMADHHYFLQYHIYLLALHRYLRSRLGNRYDYSRDMGGVLYLFVRGMAGLNTPVDEHGQPYGVFFDRPDYSVIDRLDRLMAGELNLELGAGVPNHV